MRVVWHTDVVWSFMTGVRIAYLGGGSTRAPGTIAAFIERAAQFAGSELVLFDPAREQLEIVARLGRRMAAAAGADLAITLATDRREALAGADVVLASFRPGGFEARVHDERLPLAHGVIGQETQGPGGFFLALRSLHVFRGLVEEIAECCPGALLVNYTNPVNVVAQAVTRFSDVRTVSLCEGPIVWPRHVAQAAGIDPESVRATMVGLNHACWSVEAECDGGDLFALVDEAWERAREDPSVDQRTAQLLHLTSRMASIPADYLRYYYFPDELVALARARERTRGEEIIASLPAYWQHYTEQAEAAVPVLAAEHSRAGVGELELAVAVIDAAVNDTGEQLPVNVPNHGAIAGFADDLVVEVPAICDAEGFHPTVRGVSLPAHVSGLIEMLAEYQSLTADAGWHGSRSDAIRALAAHPLVLSLSKAEALYGELASAHARHLPERLRVQARAWTT
jgi:6-phospho-beta-glucosidase